jgi:activator of HSP90 ATPase
MSDYKASNSIGNPTTRRQLISAAAIGVGSLALGVTDAWSSSTEEVSHSAEAIHQELIFKATRKRVYEALSETKQFNNVVMLSAGMKSGPPPGALPTEISREVGGTFALFAGHIVGRHLELVPQERIVQAWRVADWEPGAFSIASFRLTTEGSGTRITFDHAGFPKGLGQHLAEGWKLNYWEPLEKFLSGGAA